MAPDPTARPAEPAAAPAAAAGPSTGPSATPSTGPSATPSAGLRTLVVWETLREALDLLGPGLSVVDAGGGTGGFAVPLAELGHTVTVVDPSPDSLAALSRRAAERGCSARVRGVQGDLVTLPEVVGRGETDAVLCHNVLEVDDDPAAALDSLRVVLRPGGLLSLLAAGQTGAVLARAVSGRLAEALQILRDPQGRDSPTGGRRFDAAGLADLLAGAGFTVEATRNVRVFTDVLAGALLDSDPGSAALVAELERAAARMPAYAGLAAQLHLLARRR